MARIAKKERTLTVEEKLAQALVPDVEQPYRVPKNWCWVYLSGLLREIKNGTTIKQDKSGIGYSVTRIESLQNQTIDFDRLGTIADSAAIKETDWYIVGDIALSHINSAEHVGKTALITEGMLPLVHGMNLLRLRFFNALIPKLFQYYSRSFQYKEQILARINMAVNQVSINQKQIGSIEFPLPPLAEQQRIVDRIESLFAKLDEAKEKAQAIIDGHEDRKAAILHKAFTGELTEEWRQNNGVSRDTWNNYTIGDMFIHTTGKALKKSNTNGSLHKYITTSNLYWGRFDFSEVREMYFTYDELDKCTAKKGDLLICNGGDVGRAAIWNYDYDICIQNHISKLRKKQNNIDVVFCYYFFMLSKIKGKINSKGIGIASLSAKDLLAMPIDVPSIEEQHEISSILNELFNNEQQAKETAELVIDQIDTMKKSILARAFRGEMGTNDPNDESAIELLKRVLNDNQSDCGLPKSIRKRTTIPKEKDEKLSTGMERDIIKLFIKADNNSISMGTIMAVSSKKFDILDTLRSLEKKGLIRKTDSGDYSLVE